MRIKVTVQREEGGEKWPEEYDVPNNTDQMKWAQELIRKFNATLQPGERARRVLTVEKISDASKEHQWRKLSLVTESGPEGLYDRMQCSTCHITGKRFDLGPGARRDRKYKATAFIHCDTSVKLLEKRKERKAK